MVCPCKKTKNSQSWYLLGPVTRFQIVNEHVPYEVAQQPVSAFRTKGESLNPTAEELKVVCSKTVCMTKVRVHVLSRSLTLGRAENSAAISPQQDYCSPQSPMMRPASMNSSQSSRNCWEKLTSPSFPIDAASGMKVDSTGKPCTHVHPPASSPILNELPGLTDTKSVCTASTLIPHSRCTILPPSIQCATSTTFHSTSLIPRSRMMASSSTSSPTVP